MNECEKYLEAVLSVEIPLEESAKQHLEHCPACAALRRDAMALVPAKSTAEPPRHCDQAIRKAAAKAVRRPAKVSYILMRRALPFGAAAAAAAAVVLVLPREEMPMPEPAAAIAAAQTVPVLEWSQLEEEAGLLDQELTGRQYVIHSWMD